jgi:hypothetical protein
MERFLVGVRSAEAEIGVYDLNEMKGAAVGRALL